MTVEKKRGLPRISVTKLGEYMVASPSRRHTIVRDQKRPPEFKVARYHQVFEIVQESLASGSMNASLVEGAISRMVSATTTSTWQEQNNELSISALGCFLNLAGEIDLTIYSIEATAQNRQAFLDLANVAVSVRPEVLLRNGGGEMVGAVKVYLSKSHPLSKQAGEAVATVLHQYVAAEVGIDTNPRDCYVIDVFAGTVFRAPRAYKRLRSDLLAACTEISLRWPTV